MSEVWEEPSYRLVRFVPRDSGGEGIGVLHCEARLTHLWGIRRSNAGELRADIVDDVKVAVRAVVIPQANIGTDRLRVRSVHLNETREGQKARKGIVSLQACQHYREVTIG